MSGIAIAELKQITKNHEDRISDHEKRIRDMEKANLKLSLQMGAIFSGITLAGTWLLKFIP